MKEVGGYFELELNKGKEYHRRALRLNLGRTAFEYILRIRGVRKIYFPYYVCDVLINVVEKLGIDYTFYHINEKLEPIVDYSSVKPGEYFMYINYFGLKDIFVCSLIKEVPDLILDNAQAFFSVPPHGLDTFYSPRKFLGVPDGAYLYIEEKQPAELEQDFSYQKFGHLIGRIENSAESSYSLYRENESRHEDQTMKRMSEITRRLLDSIDYRYVIKRRRENFILLHDSLGLSNQINISPDDHAVPMVYPLLVENGSELKRRLIDNKVFVATYWQCVKTSVAKDSFEYFLADNLLALPVDQRYTIRDMRGITEIIKKHE